MTQDGVQRLFLPQAGRLVQSGPPPALPRGASVPREISVMRFQRDPIRKQLEAFFREKPILKAEYFSLRVQNPLHFETTIELLITPAPHAFHRELVCMEGALGKIFERRVSILLRPSFEAFIQGPARNLILTSAISLYERDGRSFSS